MFAGKNCKVSSNKIKYSEKIRTKLSLKLRFRKQQVLTAKKSAGQNKKVPGMERSRAVVSLV